MTTESAYVNVLDHITKDRELPAGYDAWGFRTVRPDLSSSRGYRYPLPGRVAKAPGPIIPDNIGNCPESEGDGICLATTYDGMASGGVAARTLILCAYRERDVLGGTRKLGKLRLRQFKVVDLIDGEAILANLSGAYLNRAYLSGAYLNRAYLNRAYLSGADLSGADLSGADLSGADLSGADLSGAYLNRAYLNRAYLSGANLNRANLSGANLNRTNLNRAYLNRAYLSGADLNRADLSGADLSGANLSGANLSGAYLSGANLSGAVGLLLPPGWALTPAGIAVRA